jgi:hypothetical protein
VGARIGHHVARASARFGGEAHGEPLRIPWDQITDVGVDVEVAIDVESTPLHAWRRWLSDKFFSRIPGI